MISFLTLAEVDLHDKRVILRVDLNVPIENDVIVNDLRIRAVLPTLKICLKAKARILLLSHLGRPKEGFYQEAFSLKPVAERLSQLLNHPIRLEKDWLNGINIAPREIVLGENVRFIRGEKVNDEALAKQMGSLCDIFIMDAFATAHRVNASTVGIAKFAPLAVAGPLVVAELKALHSALGSPKRPLVAIVGGAKVSDKIQVLKTLLLKVDTLIVGGGIANTFLASVGYSIGNSLFEPNLIPLAKELFHLANERKINLMVPEDVVVTRALSKSVEHRSVTNFSNIASDEKIVDVGKETSKKYEQIVKKAGTIVWNGPLGIFEIEPFGEGTQYLAQAIATSSAFSIAGGGETLAAIEKYGVRQQISYISTGGGAFLEYLEGKTLPAIAILEERAKRGHSSSFGS